MTAKCGSAASHGAHVMARGGWCAGNVNVVVAVPFCHGCDWAASGYTHRHKAALDGPRKGCCAHSCAVGRA